MSNTNGARFGGVHSPRTGWRANVELTFQILRREVHNLVSGRAMGALWMVLEPASMVAIIWFVFFRHMGEGNGIEYFEYVGSGVICWIFFSRILSSGANIFRQYRFLITKVKINVMTLIFAKLIEETIGHLIIFFAFLCILAYFGWRPTERILLFPLAYAALAVLASACALAVGTLNVFLRDIGNVVQIVTRFGLWALPIVWKVEAVSGALRVVSMYNPLYGAMNGYRWLLGSGAYLPVGNEVLLSYVISSSVIVFGSWFVHRKLRAYFAEVL